MGLFGSSKTFDNDKDVPDLSGKVILMTGGNDGIGKAACLALIKHNPAHILIGARDKRKADEAITEMAQAAPNVPVSFIALDLASLQSVHKAAAEITALINRLDLLFLNAGVMAIAPGLTPENYEIQFGINHLGHALLTKLLLPLLQKTTEIPDADVRIVITTSTGYFLAPTGGILFKDLRTTQSNQKPMARYGQSKLANILYAESMAQKYPRMTTVSVAPGPTESGMAGKVPSYGNFIENFFYSVLIYFMNRPVEVGIWNLLWGATASKEEIKNGEFYDVPFGVLGWRNKYSSSAELRDELWAWTEEQIEKEGAASAAKVVV